MAMDKSKESTRIQELLKLDSATAFLLILKNIKNQSIFEEFFTVNTRDNPGPLELYRYAVAAEIISKDDFDWIKENVNFEDESQDDAS